MATVTVAQLQLPVFAEKAACLSSLEHTLDELPPGRVDMVTLPEMFCCPYEVKNFPAYAEEEGAMVWQACSRLARDHGLYLCAGSVPECDEQGRIFNTAYVFDRQGKQIAKHRKVHLFDINVQGGQSFKESETLHPGDTITVFATDVATFGLCICYDFRFPEMGRLMALQGAEIILVPAAFNMTTGPAHWEVMFRSQALNNQVYAVGTAPARDMQASYTSWGHSIITNPWGQVVHQMEEGQGTHVATLDLDRIKAVREQLPLLQHRRTDLYMVRELDH